MRTLKQIGFIMLMGVSTLMINGCKKDDDSNLQPKGNYGNANETTSNITIASGDWQVDGANGWQHTFNAIGFNPTVGANEVFLSSDNTNWVALPVTLSANQEIAYSFNSSSLTIDDAMIGTTPLNLPTNTMYIKIVSITPAMKKLNPNTNWKNYSEVKTALNLPN